MTLKTCLILMGFFLFGANSLAAEAVLSVGMGLAKPPFIMEDQNSGIEHDIVAESFKLAHINYKFVSFPQARVVETYLQNNIDSMITVKELLDQRSYLSDSYISFQNVAISLKTKKFKIKTINELGNYNVAAFQNALMFLGQEYINTITHSKHAKTYKEYPRQESQIKMLITERVDVIILEKNIFEYFMNSFGKHIDEFDVAEIFPVNNYHVSFHNKEIRDKFNKGLVQLKKSNEYKKIFKKYLSKK